eukprot:c25064_g4_i1 orf=808-1248(-)
MNATHKIAMVVSLVLGLHRSISQLVFCLPGMLSMVEWPLHGNRSTFALSHKCQSVKLGISRSLTLPSLPPLDFRTEKIKFHENQVADSHTPPDLQSVPTPPLVNTPLYRVLRRWQRSPTGRKSIPLSSLWRELSFMAHQCLLSRSY